MRLIVAGAGWGAARATYVALYLIYAALRNTKRMVASGMGIGERIHFYFCPTFASGLAHVAMVWMEESGTTFNYC